MLDLCWMLRQLAKDERGFVVSAELVLVLTLMVCSLVVGWHAVSKALVSELTDVAGAIGALDQSYSYPGLALRCPSYGWGTAWYGRCVPYCAGSRFIDGPDACDNAGWAEVVGWSGEAAGSSAAESQVLTTPAGPPPTSTSAQPEVPHPATSDRRETSEVGPCERCPQTEVELPRSADQPQQLEPIPEQKSLPAVPEK